MEDSTQIELIKQIHTDKISANQFNLRSINSAKLTTFDAASPGQWHKITPTKFRQIPIIAAAQSQAIFQQNNI
ncbi:MAG: hypothetical protein K9J37_17580 [Saprospiraceae bacterium]|nr:hypothetical protein [Saprospiraceae bacterium]MCF8251729.1 hypothetical protein [Saprospiraceae bacterium]MCF8281111.1 hypothetical protein [Bacteroidales bacterium]MCF8311783.1 hypothetical protein [Saprospiraceae bacterium]MCF8441767.1 hypothetical protein [Saprospiraceae bacterium]